jgi:RHS repeat-associated protein
VTNYVNDLSLENEEVLMTSDVDGNYRGVYTYSEDGERISEEDLGHIEGRPNDPLYYLHDALGSMTAITNMNAEIIDSNRFAPYGEALDPVAKNSRLTNSPFGFTGEAHDIEGGLVYLRARYYEPNTMRFLQQDTVLGDIKEPLTWNLYAYGNDNPLMYTDPTGHNGVTDWFRKQVDEINKWGHKNLIDPINNKITQASNVIDFTVNVTRIFGDQAKFEKLMVKIGDKTGEWVDSISVYFGMLGYALDHPDEAWVLNDEIMKPVNEFLDGLKYILMTSGDKITQDITQSIYAYIVKFNKSNDETRINMLADMFVNLNEQIIYAAYFEGVVQSAGIFKDAARVKKVLGKYNALDKESKAIKVAAKTLKKIRFRSGYAEHLRNVISFNRDATKGIVGGHNMTEFMNYFRNVERLTDVEFIVTKTPHTSINGIFEITYKVPLKDSAGNILKGQYKIFKNPKTVYDPRVFSDAEMIKLGEEAMKDAIIKNSINGREVVGTASNGLKFKGFIDDSVPDANEITNFFPLLQ